MEKIDYYSGGIIFIHLVLTSTGELFPGNSLGTSDGPKRHVPEHLVAQAFQEARAAPALPKNTDFRTGCVRTGTSVSSWFGYNGKAFLGSNFLRGVFYS